MDGAWLFSFLAPVGMLPRALRRRREIDKSQFGLMEACAQLWGDRRRAEARRLAAQITRKWLAPKRPRRGRP
eukprot:8761714-Pyramimonas_sp.AAC.1